MLHFAITRDMKLLTGILTDPATYHRMINDAAPAREAFEIKDDSGFLTVVARDSGQPAAVFLLVPTANEAAVHMCFVPAFWGRTQAITRQFLNWVWAHTRFECLWGNVPSYNRLCLRLAQAVGFEECGTVPDAGVKNGRSFSLIVSRVRRPHAY